MGDTRAREEKPTETPDMSGLTSSIFNPLSFLRSSVKLLMSPSRLNSIQQAHASCEAGKKRRLAVNEAAMLS